MRKLSLLAASLSLTFSGFVAAQGYQTFLRADFYSEDFSSQYDGFSGSGSYNYASVAGSYYFDERPIMGPLKEFQFINQQSYVTAGATFLDSPDDHRIVGGEYITGSWVFNAHATFAGGDDDAHLSVGYMVNPNLKFSVANTSYSNIDGLFNSDQSLFSFRADYVVPFEGNDYLGLSAETDEDLSVTTLVSKYFTALSNDRYIALGLSGVIYRDEYAYFDDQVLLSGEYYFSALTSISASVNISDATEYYSIGATHYFNDRSSVNIGYSNIENSINYFNSTLHRDSEIWEVGYQYQF